MMTKRVILGLFFFLWVTMINAEVCQYADIVNNTTQVKVWQCQQNYGNCKSSCYGNGLANDKTNCLNQCNNAYQTCMNYA